MKIQIKKIGYSHEYQISFICDCGGKMLWFQKKEKIENVKCVYCDREYQADKIEKVKTTGKTAGLLNNFNLGMEIK